MKSEAGRWIVWLLALVTSLAGIWASNDLVRPSGPGKSANSASKDSLLGQMCTSFEWSDCDEAAESPWAWIPFGATGGFRMRTAALGLGFFVVMTCWFILVGWPTRARAWVQIFPVLLTAAGLGASTFFEYVMWVKLNKACPLCLMTHIASLLLFIFSILLWPRASAAAQSQPVVVDTGAHRGHVVARDPGDDNGPRAWPSNWTLVITAVVMLCLFGAVAIQDLSPGLKIRLPGVATSQPGEAQMRAYFEKQLNRYQLNAGHAYTDWVESPRFEIPVAGRPAKGPADARHTIVIFSDFQCPNCATFEQFFKEKILPLTAQPEYGSVRVVFKQWPICTDCNPAATKNLHPLACKAAYAAEAAFAMGGDEAFWKMHDLLFETQGEWKADADFAALARSIGLDDRKFTEAMSSAEVRERVVADVKDGHDLGKDLVAGGSLSETRRSYSAVDSTPAIFIDGKRFYIHPQVDAWKLVLLSPAESPTAKPSLLVKVFEMQEQLKKLQSTGPAGDLQDQLKKKDETIAAWDKYFKKYKAHHEGRWERTYLDWQLSPQVAIPVEGRPELIIGPQDPRHTIVLFSDFECPGCKQFETWLMRSILPTGRSPGVGGIRFVFKHWPICTDCNPHATTNLHPAACQAAIAAEAAFVVGGSEAFWRMHNLLFEKQDEWVKSRNFVALAQQIGLNEQTFLAAMNNPEVVARIKSDIEEGSALAKGLVENKTLTEDEWDFVKVESTPTIYVDGKRLSTPVHKETWNRILGYVPRARAATQPGANAPEQ